MGSTLSKSKGNSTNPSTSSSSSSNSSSSSDRSTSVGSNDVRLYLAACQVDPDVQMFDSKLQQHANSVISLLALAQNDLEARPCLSLDSLTRVTSGLMDVNQEVVSVILECKKDIWKSKELLSLVEDYFEYSVQTLDFFASLDQCLKRARDRQFLMQVALSRFDEEMKRKNDVGGDGDSASDRFAKTLQELRSFKDAGDPFGEEFVSLFNLVYYQQVRMLDRLRKKKRKLDKKLKSVKAYRKVSNVIFAATFVAVVICSVVAAAIAAPPVASALAAAASAPVGGMGKWFNSLWKKYEKELKDERDLINTMQLGTYITVKDLDNIRVLVSKLEVEIESLLTNADFALGNSDTLMTVMDEIRKKLDVFMAGIDNLTTHSCKYSREISQARTMILHRIIKYPSAPS